MKMKKLLIILCLMTHSAWAAKLENVDLLGATPEKDTVELKLHAKSGPKGSYFFINITKTDPDSFEKLGLVIKKLERGGYFKLDLDILSFSMSPSGSHYPSESVQFVGNNLEN
jgi:hypothetical protein